MRVPGQVLIVEDSENCASTLEIALLGIPGVSVLLAESGVEALRILRSEGGGIRAVVTDLNMPRMDGYELVRRIRADRNLSAMPVVVVSADADPDLPARLREAGVNAFFAKPYSPAEVREKVEQLLNATLD
jgi:CheY-like chemotaxis protein